MRFCVPIPCFFKGDFPDAIRKVSELGFDAVETYDWRSLDFDSVKKALCETGVELVSMCTTEFCLTDPANREKWLCGLSESCEAAKALGVKHLITQVGNDTGAPRELQHAYIVEGLKKGAPILEAAGVTLMIEPLNTIYDHKGYYLWSAVEGFEIIREVASPDVKLVYDIYHQQVMEGNIIRNITENLDCIAHLHAAGHPGRHELQFGENDYKVIWQACDKAGYTGCCGLEYSPLLEPVESLKEFIRIYK